MTEQALTKPQIIAELTRSPHGKLAEYVPIGLRAAHEDPDFFAHLLVWNAAKGQIRDAKAALPVIALKALAGEAVFKSKARTVTASEIAPVHVENALACLAALDPRSLSKALAFAKDIKAPTRLLRRFLERYLRDMESNRGRWNGVALQHRATLRELYSRYRIRPIAGAVNAKDSALKDAGFVNEVLYKNTGTGKFAVVRTLADLSAEDAAAAIVTHKIPFLIARGALGAKAKDPDVVMALIEKMSPTELVTNMKWLERLGVKTVPKLRAALEQKLDSKQMTAKPARGGTLKTTKAAEVLEDSGENLLAGKLRVLQEKQLDALKGIEGNWLVLGDKSGSMATAIDTACHIAGVLSRMVKGQVHLVFFDTSPRYLEATGKTYEEIKRLTAGIAAGGGTSVGCGVQALLDRKIAVDGIAIVSDGGDNTVPYFDTAYAKYVAAMGVEPTVYFYQLDGEGDRLSPRCSAQQIDVQTFDLRRGVVDYHSLPNLVQTMRVGRYQLLDEVLAVPLVTLDEVLKATTHMPVLAKSLVTA